MWHLARCFSPPLRTPQVYNIYTLISPPFYINSNILNTQSCADAKHKPPEHTVILWLEKEWERMVAWPCYNNAKEKEEGLAWGHGNGFGDKGGDSCEQKQTLLTVIEHWVYTFSLLITSTLPSRYYYYSHFTGKETGAWKSYLLYEAPSQERELGPDSGLWVYSLWPPPHRIMLPPFVGTFTKSWGLEFCLYFSFHS